MLRGGNPSGRLAHRERDVHQLRAAHHLQRERAAGRHAAQAPVQRVHAVHVAVVHGHDQVPGLQVRLSRRSLTLAREHLDRARRGEAERPHALTTPADTVDSNPNGLPTATTSWPARRRWVLARRAYGSAPACARSTARSVAGSRPATTAGTVRPSTNVTRACVTRCTTCSLVSR